MKLTLEALETLDAIDRRGSYAAAAEELHKVPSAMSYIVQKLERDLGVQLFDRSGHRARLTDAGRALLDHGRKLLQEACAAEERAVRIGRGWESELRIATDTLVPLRALMPFMAAFYGETTVTRVSIAHESSTGAWEALRARRSDLVIGATGHPPFTGYASKFIGKIELVFCVASTHALADAPEPLTTAQVAQYRGVSVGDTARGAGLSSPGSLAEGQEAVTVPTVLAMLDVLLAGLAVGCLPRCIAAPCLADGSLVEKQLETSLRPQEYFLAWRNDSIGMALQWWTDRLDHPDLMMRMLCDQTSGRTRSKPALASIGGNEYLRAAAGLA
ncbi:LysR family transcriptional regulator [Noviherbaspirillum denitrificans]|uniref:LysR family transcriptional regulator n=1 Tax=Noviherbaspirillum denitrificans TaxID=1968433 RepID=UPI000B52C79A|nr:LysR family transcriptional regulator [Noviherbaspirillum denitrificans]